LFSLVLPGICSYASRSESEGQNAHCACPVSRDYMQDSYKDSHSRSHVLGSVKSQGNEDSISLCNTVGLISKVSKNITNDRKH